MTIKQLMRKLVIGLIFGIVYSANVMALPAEHEMQRLLLAAGNAIEVSDMEKAAKQLERIQHLNIEPPVVYYFYQGQVFHHQNRYVEARSMLETYVVRVGSEGKFYSDALELITAGEEAEEQASEEPTKQSQSAMLPSVESNNDYLSGLKKKYEKSSDVETLVSHINKQLTANAYHGSRLKTKGKKSGIEYQIGVTSNRELLLKEKDYTGKTGPRLDVSKMDVYGVDPIIQYGCEYNRFVCWLYHPVNKSDRWILLDRNDEAASDISKAMSRLIRILQTGNSK